MNGPLLCTVHEVFLKALLILLCVFYSSAITMTGAGLSLLFWERIFALGGTSRLPTSNFYFPTEDNQASKPFHQVAQVSLPLLLLFTKRVYRYGPRCVTAKQLVMNDDDTT